VLCKHQVAGSSPVASTKYYAGIAQLVEHYLAKVDVEGSNPFSRSIYAWIAQG
jgi:hypothetical protein